MFHLVQLLVRLLLKVEGELPDNSRLVGSIFIGGIWPILVADLFPRQLGPWREWFLWGGWLCVGTAAFLILRRKVRGWQNGQSKRSPYTILR
jgi:hypothetical protein